MRLDFFPKKWQSVGSYFLRKSDLRIFVKPGETEILADGTVAEITFCPAGVQRAELFVQGMQRGAECRWHSFSTDRSGAETGSSMLGLRGKAHYRVKGETPCPVIWCLRQVVLGIIWRIVLPKIIFGIDRHMKKTCETQEADNGKTTEEGRMGKRKMKKRRINERGNQKNESYKA